MQRTQSKFETLNSLLNVSWNKMCEFWQMGLWGGWKQGEGLWINEQMEGRLLPEESEIYDENKQFALGLLVEDMVKKSERHIDFLSQENTPNVR